MPNPEQLAPDPEASSPSSSDEAGDPPKPSPAPEVGAGAATKAAAFTVAGAFALAGALDALAIPTGLPSFAFVVMIPALFMLLAAYPVLGIGGLILAIRSRTRPRGLRWLAALVGVILGQVIGGMAYVSIPRLGARLLVTRVDHLPDHLRRELGLPVDGDEAHETATTAATPMAPTAPATATIPLDDACAYPVIQITPEDARRGEAPMIGLAPLLPDSIGAFALYVPVPSGGLSFNTRYLIYIESEDYEAFIENRNEQMGEQLVSWTGVGRWAWVHESMP